MIRKTISQRIARRKAFNTIYFLFILNLIALPANSQTVTIMADTSINHQVFEGFGSSIAWYENWLLAHPNKEDIYDTIFGELSLDILRIRNAHDYNPEMVENMAEIYDGANVSLGHPIKILSTSWGPPAYLKSNGDRKNGGTLKYTADPDGVTFDYSGFTEWWRASLDDYNAHGIYPDYISMQNEPDFTAVWESCRFSPVEEVTASDTMAGYNIALDSIYNMVQERAIKPKLLAPEVVGIGYDRVQDFVDELDTSHFYGIAHHLYHGTDGTDIYSADIFNTIGDYIPEKPHFQTEYDGADDDWFKMPALIYTSLNNENVSAYLSWKLIWADGDGLVTLENPWDEGSWTTPEGYIVHKRYYAYKQFSTSIHPNWQRIDCTNDGDSIKAVAFSNPDRDTVSLVMINRSTAFERAVTVSIEGYVIDSTSVIRTSDTENYTHVELTEGAELVLPKRSVTSIRLISDPTDYSGITSYQTSPSTLNIYPNPSSNTINIQIPQDGVDYELLSILDASGRSVQEQRLAPCCEPGQNLVIDCSSITPGMYFCKIESATGKYLVEKFFIINE